MEQQRGALGGVGVLVGVDRDRRDALDRERPRRHRSARAARHRAAPSRRCRRPRGSAPHARPPRRRSAVTGSTTPCAYDGALATTSTVSLVDRVGHRGGVGAEVGADRHQDRLDPEVVRGLVEGGVGGGGQHHPRSYDVGPAVPRPLHGQQDRLGAAGGHGPDRRPGSVEQAAGEADQLVLHLQQGRERRRVERRWSAAYAATASRRDPVDLGIAGVVDVGQGPPAVHRQVGSACSAFSRSRGSGTGCSFRGRHLGGVQGVLPQPPQADEGQCGRQRSRSPARWRSARSRAG